MQLKGVDASYCESLISYKWGGILASGYARFRDG
jgi:hypothetical protein